MRWYENFAIFGGRKKNPEGSKYGQDMRKKERLQAQ